MEGFLVFCAINSHASAIKGCYRDVLKGRMTVNRIVMCQPHASKKPKKAPHSNTPWACESQARIQKGIALDNLLCFSSQY